MLQLDPTLPKTRAVEHAIRTAIADGRARPGMRLPSSRELALELGVARNTIVAVTDDLVAEGVLEARARAGTFVARSVAPLHSESRTPASAGPEFDLRPGRPEAGSFPTARWLTAIRRAGAAAADVDSDGAGSVALRSELASYLARARGVETTADAIVICAGYRTASTLVAAALAAGGASSVAIEDPSLFGIERPWSTSGFTVSDLVVDEDGADLGRLDARTDAVVLTPSHQFPLGGALAPARRRLVVDWAMANDRGFIVEDDYDGEFRFDRRPVAALQRSAPERVVYAGSVSKTLAPDLRLGWLVLPPDLVRPVVDASEALTGGAPMLNQLALADLIRTGEYERHIRRQRREYARRRTHLQQALRSVGLEVPGLAAGLHGLIPLGDAAPTVLSRLESQPDHVGVHRLARYTRSHDRPEALVVGFATPSRARFEPAIEALTSLLTARDSRPPR